ASIFQMRKAISISEIASAIDTTEENVDEILIQLSKSGLISYDKPSAQDSVKLILPRVDTNRFVFEYKRISDGYINAQRKLEQMVQFTTSNECRFKYILTYFGEKVSNYKCGKCDNCLSIHQLNDHSVEYIQELVLRTLYQTEEGLSENNLYSILCGTSKSENFRKFTTYAACANYTKFEIGRVIDFSLTKRLIKIEVDRKKRFFLTNSGKNLLIERGLIDEQANEQPDYELDLQLLHLLKEERAKASSKYSQPKFLICSDDVLQEIVKRKPTTRNRLLSIKGFNERTFTKVGEKFLAIINDYNDKELFSEEKDAPRELSIPNTVTETLNLINKGCTLSEICEIRGLAEAVISMQIETLIENDNTIDISKLFDEKIYSLIKNKFEKGIVDIKSLKDSLPTSINYSMIRIVLAKLKSTIK
ncbi:MAG TPA: helix-turn-helix domain-containing protein, partial [Ignavibacteriaceae bacterium]|nr:helix-turn-helix domain-containing protein [Ignavibacteriaceae bacterium]